ncbi:MAG: class I SAM-dependent methyltransferase [Chloroflexales bacterium]|nr:class I SAM-dependent methyltransferase [Chloroflexales bacterium]
MNILDRYITTPPSPQNAIDIFCDAWSTSFPAPLDNVVAGPHPLFEDIRISWAAEHLGGFQGKTVLELGPLEAAQSYLLEKSGADRVLAIEANTSAYLKCLIVKELFKLQRVEFLCGDFMPYLRTNSATFDIGFASGVLYHMRRPAELIHLLSRVTDRLFVWTHYYDHDIIKGMPQHKGRFRGKGRAKYAGFEHTLYRQEYQTFLNWDGFCGGNAAYSYWMSRSDIIACLKYFGYDELHIGFEDTAHYGGPSFAIAAIRSQKTSEQIASHALPLEYWIEEALVEKETNWQDHARSEMNGQEVSRSLTEQDMQQSVLAEQNAYISRLEQTIKEKNNHIAALEQLLHRINDGRLMRLMHALQRSKK